jgi:hypothetical protein
VFPKEGGGALGVRPGIGRDGGVLPLIIGAAGVRPGPGRGIPPIIPGMPPPPPLLSFLTAAHECND